MITAAGKKVLGGLKSAWKTTSEAFAGGAVPKVTVPAPKSLPSAGTGKSVGAGRASGLSRAERKRNLEAGKYAHDHKMYRQGQRDVPPELKKKMSTWGKVGTVGMGGLMVASLIPPSHRDVYEERANQNIAQGG